MRVLFFFQILDSLKTYKLLIAKIKEICEFVLQPIFKSNVMEAAKRTSVAMPIYLWVQEEVPIDGWSIFIDF